ncbi:SUMF1/EgtB/PvdO family nonheme iron enzyme [candidate division CSSED10-310 bacterium]|uniref:SUMF1/EgtB/PvdO family nonheme iron enzyme n=1 Tax=candidate division CSSED10-310 bacterium TaxID=2855610 RepID=A0ABV6YYB7_UNCC1
MTENNTPDKLHKSEPQKEQSKSHLSGEQTFEDLGSDTNKVKHVRESDSSSDAGTVDLSSADKPVFDNTPTAPMAEAEIKEIGKYKVEKIIGKGGMGTVFKAFDPYIERHVAIKMMSETQFDQDLISKRFFREAKAIGQLQHPNIIMIHDAGKHHNNPYLVVEFLEGHDLGELAVQELLPPTLQLLSFMKKICDALQYAHDREIIHRDIKPANIFLTNAGEIKLMDFGIAKIEDSTLTKTGMLVGTLHYMSPEQINGQALDHRTDIYSLGVVIFELFSQRLPFEGETITQLIRNILLLEPQDFEPSDHDLPDMIKEIVARALDKDIENRYQSASTLGADLLKCRTLYERKIKGEDIDPDKSLAAREQSQEIASLPVHKKGISDTSSTEAPSLEHHPATTKIAADQVQTKERDLVSGPVKKTRSATAIYFISIILGLILLVWFGFNHGDLFSTDDPPAIVPKATPGLTRIQKTPEVGTITPKKSVRNLEAERRKEIESEWQFAHDQNNKESYQAFITKFSPEPLAVEEVSLAQSKLTEIEKQEAPPVIQNGQRNIIQTSWQKVKAENTPEAYTDFLQQYNSDRLAAVEVEQAKKNLRKLKQVRQSKLLSLIKTGPDMVPITGGIFEMGDLFGDGDRDETPHSVSVNSFSISKYEVTFAEYDAFCQATGRVKPLDSGAGRALYPVINVSWYDALEYCNWLSESKGLKPCYTIDKTTPDPNNKCVDDQGKWSVSCDFAAPGYRLPTETEWEYAARQRGQKVKFSLNQGTANPKNINFDNKFGALPIGSLSSNSLKLFDMSGNVWEWCWNWYGPYDPTATQHPTGALSGEARVIRGGSWKNTSAAYIRTSNRLYAAPQSSDDDLGFRIVQTRQP